MSDGLSDYWAQRLRESNQAMVPRYYGEAHNQQNSALLEAITDRHRSRVTEYGRLMVRADLGLPPMPDALYAMWLGKEGCVG